VKSIRRRLILWLLPGFALLWLGGGTAIYVMFRSSEMARVDAELDDAARGVRLTTAGENPDGSPGRGPMRRRARRPEFDQAGSGYYYEIRDADDRLEERSGSLGERSLPQSRESYGLPATREFADGEPVRLVAVRIGPGGPPGMGQRRGRGPRRGEQLVATVGISLEATHRSLAALVTGLAVTGAIGAGAGALLIGLALKDGMRPLDRLTREVDAIAPGSLSTRFATGGLPRELGPVVERLNDLLARLEESFERERRFSADLSHELRTPLAEARGLLELGLRFPEERTEARLREAIDSCGRMERMIGSMLQLARSESSPADMSEAVALRPLVERTLASLAGLADERRIRIEIEGAPDIDPPGHPELWAQVIDNLLSNAVTHAPEGGRVGIRCSEAVPLSVSNPAPDLGPDDVARMFDRLWRADPSRHGESHSGLGLSIARACARAMGFELQASLDGEGRLTLRVEAPGR